MTSTARPIGRLTKKIQRQLSASVSAPPSTGPTATATPTVEPQNAIAVPRACPEKSCAIRARAVVNIAAPPTPWNARARSSWSPLCASPQRSDASVKTATPATKMRLRPKRSASVPYVRSSDASESA